MLFADSSHLNHNHHKNLRSLLRPHPPQKPQPVAMHHIGNIFLGIATLT